MNSLKTAIGACLALSLMACATKSVSHEAEVADYRISVEIPLDELHLADAEILKVDELLNERTAFDAEDFQLDEVVLIARADGGASGNAELLVLEWRSGQIDIPEGSEEDWFEVRIPAPEEDLGGAWLLDVTGGVTVDMLVAVLTPRPQLVAAYDETRTVYRTSRTTVYRDRVVYPRTYHVHWIYDPSRYYVYHYHGIWPYRYYIGPWEYRYYDLSYRPYRYHYGPIYRARPHGYRYRGRIRDVRPARSVAREFRRIDPELVKLRRNHPRLQPFRQSVERRRANPRPGRRVGSGDVALQSRNAIPRQPRSRSAQRTTGAAARRDSGASPGSRAADLNRLQRNPQSTRTRASTAAGEPRQRVLRQAERRPAATTQRQAAPPRQAQTTRSAPPVRSRAPQRQATPSRSSARQSQAVGNASTRASSVRNRAPQRQAAPTRRAQTTSNAPRATPSVRSRAPQRQATPPRSAARQSQAAGNARAATSPTRSSSVRSRVPQRQAAPTRRTETTSNAPRATPSVRSRAPQRQATPPRSPARQSQAIGNAPRTVSPARSSSVRSRPSPQRTAPARSPRQTPVVRNTPRATAPSRSDASTRTLSQSSRRAAPAPVARRQAPARPQSRAESPRRSNARTRSLQGQSRSAPPSQPRPSRSSNSRARIFERR